MPYNNWLPIEDRETVTIVGAGFYCFKKSGTGTKLVAYNPNIMKGV